MTLKKNYFKKIEIVKYYSLYSNHNSKGTMVKFRTNYWRTSYQEDIFGITGANLAWFRSKETEEAGSIIANAGDFTE